jgi:hypothetical protein
LVDLSYDLVVPFRDDEFVAVNDSEFLPGPLAMEAMTLYIEHLSVSQDLLREVLKCAA